MGGGGRWGGDGGEGAGEEERKLLKTSADMLVSGMLPVWHAVIRFMLPVWHAVFSLWHAVFRFYGRRMLLFLSSHRDFDKMLEKHIPAKDLAAVRDTVFTLKTKVRRARLRT